MSRRSIPFLYAFILLANTLVLATAQTNNNTTTNITSIITDSTNYECAKWSLLRERPLIKDCFDALSKLPLNPKPGYFHDHVTVYDDYQFPVWRTNGICEMKVRLSSKPRVELVKEIDNAANRLINLYIETVRIEEHLRTGGWINVGSHQGIIVSMTNPLKSGGVGNRIVASAARDS